MSSVREGSTHNKVPEGVQMPSQPKHELLARDIAAAIENNYIQRPASRALLFAGIALACLQPGQADALTLGELKVQSAIGQPLVSTTTARITSGETLGAGCVSSVATPTGGLNSPKDLTVTIPEAFVAGEYPVRITSAKPLYEPMYEIRLQVKCPGSVSLARSYVVMMNMPMTSPQTQPVNDKSQPVLQANKVRQAQPDNNTPQIMLQDQPATSEAAPATASAPVKEPASEPAPVAMDAKAKTAPRPYTERFPTPMEPINASVDYRVGEGDTLSTIAQRIQDRPANSTYEVAAAIHQLNPDAFVNNDPNLVKLGSVLSIPPIEQLLGQEKVAMRPNPAVIAEKEITAPVVEQITDKPVETSIDVPKNEIITPQALAEAELNEEITPIEPATAAPEEPISTNQDVKVEADIPNPVPTLVANDAQVTEPEILVDRSLLENLPDQESIEPIAESEVRKLNEYEPEIAVAQGESAITEDDSSFSIHPLLIAGLGALLAFIIAFMMFGKRLLAIVSPNRAAQRNAKALDLPDDLNATVNQEHPEFGADADTFAGNAESGIVDESNATDEEPEQTVMPAAADIGAGTDTDVDLDIGATAEDQLDSLDLDLNSLKSEGTQDNVQQVDLVDIESPLDEEAPLEKTERFSGPEFSSEGVELDQIPSELDGTGTMRKLFSEEADKRKAEEAVNNEEFTVTQEMPGLTADVDLDETSDLQSLADIVGIDNPDNQMSATLTQALGLLEQDYEDEFSEIQVLEHREIEAAFTEHANKNN
jgi:FimV-like protein